VSSSRKDVNIRVRIERAKKHLVELNGAAQSFFATNPYEIRTKRNADTRRIVYYLWRVEAVPAEISAIAGDVLTNLRSSLDHLAWQLVLANGQTPGKGTYFPIREDLTKYMAQRAAIVKEMGSPVANILDGIKPFKGGNEDLCESARF
jgi:hypothetical protein